VIAALLLAEQVLESVTVNCTVVLCEKGPITGVALLALGLMVTPPGLVLQAYVSVPVPPLPVVTPARLYVWVPVRVPPGPALAEGRGFCVTALAGEVTLQLRLSVISTV